MEHGRFALLSEEETAKLSENARNQNTIRSTKTWLCVYEKWATLRGMKKDLEMYDVAQLNDVLANFFGEIRKANGDDYEPDSLRVMQSSIHRYLTECKYGKNILSDDDFKGCRDVLEGKARLLREMGKGKKPNASSALTKDEEELLWSSGRLGCLTPTSLVRTMWFNNIQHFGLRGVQEHVSMTMDNFERKTDENGHVFIEFSEDPTKCRQQGLHPNLRVTNPKMFATEGPR